MAVALLSAALIAGACASGDDGDAAQQADADAPTATETAQPSDDSASAGTDAPDSGESADGGSADDPVDDVAADAAMEPQYGGTLRYAVEAGTQNPWVPQFTLCAIACQAVTRSIFDTLMMLDADGIAQPHLLESMVPNADFTEWTLTVRDGISFHDGVPFDGAAVAVNLEMARFGPLTGPILSDVDTIEASGNTVTITTLQPWASLPAVLSGQAGFMASPAWLQGVNEETASPTEPVGTGPFVYHSFTPEEFVALRNDNYWREGLPYLDRIEFPVIADDEARVRALRSGQIHAAQGITDARSIELEQEGFSEINDIGLARESTVTLFNNEIITDVRIRRAMAMAIDQEAQLRAFNDGLGEVSNGPFAPGTVGYLEDSGDPSFDPDAARALIAEVEAETGQPVTIRMKVVGSPSGGVQSALTQTFFENVGINVELDQVDQGTLIFQVLTGQYEVAAFRWYGTPHPDLLYPYFHSSGIVVGNISTNFHRAADPAVDELLDAIRAAPDPDTLRDAAERLNLYLNEQAYIVWHNWNTWRIAYASNVHNVGGPYPLPDGGEAIRMGLGGTAGDHNFAQIWIEP